jgi:small-conductance mechanosensitive channel
MDVRGFFTSLDIGWTNATLATVVAILSFVLIHGAVMLFRRRLGKLSAERAQRPIVDVLAHTLARTSGLAVLATSLLIGATLLDLPPPWGQRINHLWFFTLGAQLALWLHRAIGVTARRYFRVHGKNKENEQVTVAHTLVIWAMQWSVWTVFLLAMLANLGINVTTFVASLGIGGIALALAVQNVLGDLFASLSIAIDKPFEVGDSISVPEFSGTIEHVGLKTTRIRALSGEQIVIANAELLRKTVHNFKRMHSRRVQFTLRINPATPPELAAKVPPQLSKIIEGKEKVRLDHVNLTQLDQNFIEYDIVYNLSDADYGLFLKTQEQVLLEAMALCRDLGVSTAPRAQQLVLSEAAGPDQAANDAPDARRPDGRGQAQARPVH